MMQELSYIRCGDYYIPDIRLPKETRPIGRWGRMHRDYIKEHNPIRFNDLCLNGELWTYAPLPVKRARRSATLTSSELWCWKKVHFNT